MVEVGQSWPSSTNNGPKLTKFGKSGPCLIDLAQYFANCSQTMATLGRLLAKSGPNWAKSRHPGQIVHNFCASIGQLQSKQGLPGVNFRGAWQACFPQLSSHLILCAMTKPPSSQRMLRDVFRAARRTPRDGRIQDGEHALNLGDMSLNLVYPAFETPEVRDPKRIGRSVGRSVGRSIRRSVNRAVGRAVRTAAYECSNGPGRRRRVFSSSRCPARSWP